MGHSDKTYLTMETPETKDPDLTVLNTLRSILKKWQGTFPFLIGKSCTKQKSEKATDVC